MQKSECRSKNAQFKPGLLLHSDFLILHSNFSLLHSGRLDRRHRKLGFVVANEDRDQPCWIFVAHIGEYLVHAIWRLVKILSTFVDGFRLSFDFVAKRAGGDMTNHRAGMAMRRRRLSWRNLDIADKHPQMIAIHCWKLMRIRRFGCAGGARRALCDEPDGRHYKQCSY